MLGAFAIVGFVVLPALLTLDLLAPGRHFPGGRCGRRAAAGGVAACALGVGISAALGLLLAPEPVLPRNGPAVLAAAALGALLDRLGGEWLDRLSGRARGLVSPAAWLDDRVAAVARRGLCGGLLLFGMLHLPAAAGIAASLAFLARPVRSVAAAVATPVGIEEADGA